MFGNEPLARCQERKATLLQQSAVNRGTLVTAAQNIRPVVSWVDLGLDLAHKTRLGWTALAPLLSVWQTRKDPSSGFVQRITGAVSLARSLLELWKNW